MSNPEDSHPHDINPAPAPVEEDLGVDLKSGTPLGADLAAKLEEIEARVAAKLAAAFASPVDPVLEAPVETTIEAPVEAVVQEVIESLVEDAIEIPIEAVVETPIEAVAEEPIESLVEETVEPIVEEPIESVVEEPVGSIVQDPVETIIEEQIESVAEAPTEPIIAETFDATPVAESEAVSEEKQADEVHAVEEPHTHQEGGIEILVSMAEKGEIDAKNIDIIDVTDRFLQAIAAAPKENLRQSGKILFHASVLLRMKAEAMLALANDDESFALDDFMEFDENGSPIIYDSRSEPVARQITLQDLERALVRRSNTRQFRQRKVTLEQLIEALRDAERIDTARSQKRQVARIDLAGQHEINDVEDILDLAHDEDIEVVIQRIEEILSSSLGSTDLLSLLELIKLLDKNGDWVDAFLGVLFLSNAGKITLEQEQFYGPLYIVRAEPPAPTPKSA